MKCSAGPCCDCKDPKMPQPVPPKTDAPKPNVPKPDAKLESKTVEPTKRPAEEDAMMEDGILHCRKLNELDTTNVFVARCDYQSVDKTCKSTY